MKLTHAIEGGLTGAGTLSLLQKAINKVTHSPRPLLHQTGLLKKFKKNAGKRGMKSTKLYIQLASEVLSNASLFGLSGLGKKKNAVLRGTLLGATAGLGTVFFQKEKGNDKSDDLAANGERIMEAQPAGADTRKKVLTVALYTAGGLLAGLAVKKFSAKKTKKSVKKMKKKLHW